ncbi:response regulator [Leptolyngbya sp. O-77]|uniref:response regulator n=1 Tax=Leptolyngbya sp. O-77 TaxID=1080068 RepID=UPI0009FED426|nr:response regulator [Leptolyngbya sp. O-77]
MASLKILIVDDSKTIRMQVRDMLPRGSYEVIEARDGVEGLHVIRQERPNLVLLDFFMPRMNGWEVVQTIQADPPAEVDSDCDDVGSARRCGKKPCPELFDYFEFVGQAVWTVAPVQRNSLGYGKGQRSAGSLDSDAFSCRSRRSSG